MPQNRKEVVILEPDSTRYKWIQSALTDWPIAPRLLHFKQPDRLLQYLIEQRPESQSFFLIDAREAKRNAGFLLQQLRKHTTHQFTPIVLSCPDVPNEGPCLLKDSRINATVLLPREKDSFQEKIRSTFTFWGRFNITT